ncbi:sensor histidine kinase [Allokutzneria sp. NRRL B-24872]|uniref:sensor histidine kinase n=1 Tax=Allokutzneria sp. NRRL B-24872 TaxID=1137961 RepID=UPI00143DA4DB|nr:histidine kinase [Allokutzneria sp. NRRL B-24872]
MLSDGEATRVRARLRGDRRRPDLGLAALFLAATALIVTVLIRGAVDVPSLLVELSLFAVACLSGIVVRQRFLVSVERRHAEELRDQRLRLAADLHDVLGHHLSAISVRTYLLDDLVPEQRSEISSATNEIRESGRAAVADLGELVAHLRGEAGARARGLDGVAELVRVAEAAGNEVELRVGELGADLPQEVGAELYWVLREALTNVVRHSSPTRVLVRVEIVGAELVVGVSNERCRVDRPRRLFPGTGFGLRGMRERVRRLGGRVETGRVSGGGYRVLAAVPVSRTGLAVDRTA